VLHHFSTLLLAGALRGKGVGVDRGRGGSGRGPPACAVAEHVFCDTLLQIVVVMDACGVGRSALTCHLVSSPTNTRCNQTGQCEEGGRANVKLNNNGIREQTSINMHGATVLEEHIAIFDVDTNILECFLVFFKMPLNNGNTLYTS
jgi:hypothetical protein